MAGRAPLRARAFLLCVALAYAGAGINLWHDSTTRGFRIQDEDIGFVGLGNGGGLGGGEADDAFAARSDDADGEADAKAIGEMTDGGAGGAEELGEAA